VGFCGLQEEALKFPRTWHHLTAFIEYTYYSSKKLAPKINDYGLNSTSRPTRERGYSESISIDGKGMTAS
jgi:hypothetical protein